MSAMANFTCPEVFSTANGCSGPVVNLISVSLPILAPYWSLMSPPMVTLYKVDGEHQLISSIPESQYDGSDWLEVIWLRILADDRRPVPVRTITSCHYNITSAFWAAVCAGDRDGIERGIRALERIERRGKAHALSILGYALRQQFPVTPAANPTHSTGHEPANHIEGLQDALTLLGGLGESLGPTSWIAGFEVRLRGTDGPQVRTAIEHEGFGRETLEAALLIKRISAQIDVLVHAIGILNALPYILEPGEVVESLSLGAGNTGRAHDLETDRRVAEFKFILWRGGPESIRQNGVFKDLFNLVSNPTTKRRVLYLVGTKHATRFLQNNRALSSVLKDAPTAARFYEIYGDRFQTVGQYYAAVRDSVEIVDLAGLVPGLGAV